MIVAITPVACNRKIDIPIARVYIIAPASKVTQGKIGCANDRLLGSVR